MIKITIFSLFNVMEINCKIIDVSRPENAIKIFAEAFKDDPMHLLIFEDDSNRLEKVEAIYRFVVSCIVPEQKLTLKGLEYNEKLAGVIIITEPGNKREWTPHLIEEGKKAGLITGENYGKIIREYYAKTLKYRYKKPHYYINELAVSPEFQGSGFGKEMMKYVENSSDNDVNSYGIALDTSNPKNVKYYENLGYKVNGKFRLHGIKGFSMFKRKRMEDRRRKTKKNVKFRILNSE